MKNKGSSFKKKYNILITEAGVLKSKYIKHRLQEKKYQYQDYLQSSQPNLDIDISSPDGDA